MKKRILSLVMALVLAVGLLPVGAMAGDTVTVTVTMDTQSVAEDVTAYGLTALPTSVQVTVPADSTIAAVMTQWALDQNVTVTGADDGYITAIGDFGDYSSSQFDTLCAHAGLESKPSDFQFAGWTYALNGQYGNGIATDKISQGDTIAFRYGVYMTSGTWVQADHEFLDAYNAVKTLIGQAKSAKHEDYTADQWNALQTAKSSAENLKAEIDKDAAGMWFNYFANNTTTLWGPGTPTDKLQKAQQALENAINKIVSPTSITFEKNNITLSLGNTYTIQPTVDPDGTSQEVTYEAFLGDTCFSVSDTGIITPTKTSSLCWIKVTSKIDSNVFEYFKFKIISNAEMVTTAKDQLTWDLIKGLNTSPSAVTSPLSLPSQITLTDNLGIVSVSWTSDNLNVIANDGTITRPAESTQVTLTATLTAGTETDFVLFPVTVTPPSTADADASKMAALMEGIASGYTDTYDNSKVIIDMAAYEDLNPTTTHKLSADAKQKYVNFVTSAVTDSNAGDTTCALSIISLQGLGYDPQQLYPVNSNTALSIVTKLNGVAHAESAWNAPYTLAAYNQGSYGTDSYEQVLITKILANQENDGSWTEWGDSIQTTANMIMGLSFYRNQANVQAAIDKAVAYLSSQQELDGTFDAYGSGADADTCAMVVMALAAAGINPDTDSRFIRNGSSALDGLLLFALEDNSGSGFGHKDNETLNAYATEEGFRALIAASQVMDTRSAYNIYDFSANPVTPARETGNSSSDKPTTPPTKPNNDITVTVTIKADTGYWLRSKSVTVSEGSTVCGAFVTALEGTGITQVGAETGYIRSITKNGVTLAEFTQGPNSGWLYKVNGELPNVGVTTYTLNAGDSIVLYYTEDWTKDPSAGGNSGPVTPAPTTPSATLTPEGSANSKGEATVKVDADAVKDSLAQAEKENASALVIAPKVTGQADTVTTQLPLSAAETISQDSDLDLTVQTDDAAVTIPNEALSSIVSQSSGSQTIEIVVKTCDPDTLKDQAAGLDLENAAAVEVTIRSGGSPITTFGGQALAIDLPVDKTVYTEGSHYKVLVLSTDGTVETLTGQCIREKGGLVVRVFTSHLSTFLVTTQTVLPFTDVDGHWALDAIRFVYDQGLMTGTKETLFSPKKPLNRAMLATILYRMEGSPAVTGENPYTDVAAGTWYTDAVLWASEQGIVNGYGNGKFGPLNNITREQLAAMLLRYSDYKKYNTDAQNDLASYADADDISAWALEALRWANAQGLVTGRTETTLVPQGDTTRAETATILMRYLDTIAG